MHTLITDFDLFHSIENALIAFVYRERWFQQYNNC